MNLTAVSRVLNEDVLIESFVRHHAEIVDQHLILDNGSTDETLNILRELKKEGLRLTVLQNKAPFFTEMNYNTSLFRQAWRLFSPDWVLFLDADEFIDARQLPHGLKPHLAAFNEEVGCVAWSVVDYVDLPTDDQNETIVPKRLRSREKVRQNANSKVLVRGHLADHNIFIDAGQHLALLGAEVVPAYSDQRVPLAHYFRRSPWQQISKSVLGHLKVLAAGQSERKLNRSCHYRGPFEAMRDNPRGLLTPPFMENSYGHRDLIEDPIQYLGGPLRYTPASDPMFKAVRVLLTYAEQLAENHGMFIDTNLGVRLQAEQATAQWQVLF
jgi:glycosyltransferase involved in cell wall biosynthesis